MVHRLLACSILVFGCIEDPAASADPERDMQLDMALDRGPDASEVCAALPTCPPDSEPVDVCPDDTCFIEELCTWTVLCHPQDCEPAIDPCPNGTVPVDATCPMGVNCIEVVDECLGYTTICAPIDCACPDGSFSNDCDLDDPDCFALDCGLVCERQCTAENCIEVDACRYADDPYCAVDAQCGTACLDPAYCGPGGQPTCVEGIYAPDCNADDPHCVQVHACNSEHWCRLPCPRHTEQVEVCVGGDPVCWTMEDGTACMSTGCYPLEPVQICGSLTPVDACEADPIPDQCGSRFLCGYEALCDNSVNPEPCEDGVVDCGPNARIGICQPDGRECGVSPSCGGWTFCVECPPDDPNCGE